MMQDHPPTTLSLQGASRPLCSWLAGVCLLLLVLVAVGGMTRLTGSGLSMVDWRPILGTVPPLGEAQWEARFVQYQAYPEYRLRHPEMTLAEFKTIFRWEYAHRLMGRVVGVAFAVPFLYFLVRRRVRGRLAAKLGIALLLGGAQGLLGWYMVRSGLVDQPQVSHLRLAAHLTLAFALFGYLVWLVLDVAPGRLPAEGEGRSRLLLAVAIVFLALLALQVVYGAFMAGLGAGYAFPEFPTMMGFWVPPGMLSMEPALSNFANNPTTVHFIHRGLGWLLLLAAVLLASGGLALRLNPAQRFAVFGVSVLTFLQFLLGVMTVVLAVPRGLAVVHQVTACLLSGAAAALVHEAWAGLRAPRRLITPMPRKDGDPDAVHHGTLGADHVAEKLA